MSSIKTSKIFLSVVSFSLILATLGFVFVPKGVHADTIVTDSNVFDNFTNLLLRPDPNAYWWTTFSGDGGTGTTTRVENQYSALQGSVNVVDLNNKNDQNNQTALEVSLKPQPVDGIYTLAEISELSDGFSFGTPGRWNPTIGHPVTFEARVRFGDNYIPDGTGGAVGSAGVSLWSNPIDATTNPPTGHPGKYHLIGFAWSMAGSVLTHGLQAGVVTSSFPRFFNLPSDTNMQDWHSYKFVWSQINDTQGNVDFYLDDQFLGSKPVDSTRVHDLSVEVWDDNIKTEFTSTGLAIHDVPVPAEQHFNIDHIHVSQE